MEVTSITAARLVENYLCAKDGTLLVPLREAWNLAVAIMAALIEGYEPKKAEPAAAPASGTAPDEMTASEATAGSTMPEPSPIA